MTDIIKLETLELQLAKEFLTDENNIKKIQTEIDNLKNNIYDFSTLEGIKEAKELKTKANKFVKELKEFCEPLEADGKKISNARSAITAKLSTGKDAVIEQILAPVYEREEKLKSVKSKLFVPSLSSQSNAEKLIEIESLVGYDWLAFKDEAEKLLGQHKNFLINEKIKFDEEVKLAKEAEEKAKIERENQIRLEAEARAKEIAEREAQKAIDEANERAKQAEIEANAKIERARLESERLEREKQIAIEAEKRKAEMEAEAKKQAEAREKADAEKLAKNKEHQAKIHNEILEDLFGYLFGNIEEEIAKDVVRAIAQGKIRNLKIIY